MTLNVLFRLLLASVLLAACSARPPLPTTTPVAPYGPVTAATGHPAEPRQQDLPEQIRVEIARYQQDSAAPDWVQGFSLKQGVATFYRNRDYRPAWQDPALRDQLLAALAGLRDDGLDPSEYSLQALLQLRDHDQKVISVTDRARQEILATRACLLALVHLYRGKVDPRLLNDQWNFSVHALDAGAELEALNRAVEQHTIGTLFDQARPDNPAYQRLRDGLQHLYAVAAAGGWPELPDGPTLKPGMTDARVPLLRRRLAAAGLLPPNRVRSNRFDAQVETAVKRFQQEQYLAADGAVGEHTRAVLNVPVQARIDQVRANLERERWVFHEINGNFVLVDIAGFTIHYYRDGKPVWSSRVQVGKPYRSTPTFKSRITYVTFNPTWTIPPTIFKEDVLPKLQHSLAFLSRHRLRVLDSEGHELEPTAVDWQRPGNIMLREDAGQHNPLGRLLIRFPNPYSIYLHDTPNRRMFNNGRRAFSSGCIRVERPLELVELLFNDSRHWDRQAIESAIASGETRDVFFPVQVPILLLYSTARVTEDGRVVFKPDIYERDPPLVAALGKPWATVQKAGPIQQAAGGW